MCEHGRPAGFESFNSGVGNLRSEMHSELSRKANAHELSSTRSDVDRLERTMWELRSEIDGLRLELNWASDRIQELEGQQHFHEDPVAPSIK